MSYKPRKFTVRGFDALVSVFNKPTGLIEQVPTFSETTVINQFEAIALMLTTYQSMSAFNMAGLEYDADIIGCCDLVTQFPNQQIFIVDLKIKLNTADKVIVKTQKPLINETVKRWAEKCRVKGLRGWRCSAIKTPTYEYNDDDTTVVRIQVILSNAIIYSTDGGGITCNISPRLNTELLDDLGKLRKQLGRAVTWLGTVHFKHSLLGEGELL